MKAENGHGGGGGVGEGERSGPVEFHYGDEHTTSGVFFPATDSRFVYVSFALGEYERTRVLTFIFIQDTSYYMFSRPEK